MRASRLIVSEGAIAAPQAKDFTIEPGALHTVFARGLGEGETVNVELLASDVEVEAAVEGDWLLLDLLTPEAPTMALDSPGVYRVTIASSAGAVFVGSY